MNDRNFASLNRKQVRSQALEERVLLVTRAGFQQLKQKLGKLRQENRSQKTALASSIEDYPDLRENATYDFIKNKLNYEIPKTAAGIRDQLAVAVIYKERGLAAEVCFGDTVKIVDDTGTYEVILAGPIEASGSSEYCSYLSPLGRAIWGAMLDRDIEFSLPDGQRRSVRIGAIRKPLD